MKNKFLLLLLVWGLAFNVHAHNGLRIDIIEDVSWTPVNVSICPLHLFSSVHTDVYGVYLSPGVVGIAKNVYGISAGTLLMLFEGNNYGITASAVSMLEENNGLSLGGINICTNNGLSLGAANLLTENYGISAGAINLLEHNDGLSIGAVNLVSSEDSTGASIGVVNIVDNDIFQFGLYNQADSGLQIGLLNYNSKAMIPWLPLFNYSSCGKSKR